MTVKVDERIKVGVIFREEGEKIEPKWFSWRGRHLKITTHVWRERDGKNAVVGSGKRTVIFASSYEARRVGIKTGMTPAPATPLFDGFDRTQKLTKVVDRINNLFGEY